MILEFNGKTPKIHPTAFIAENAVIIGDAEIGENTSVWFGAVLRGDINKIRIGKNSNIQDNSVLHTEPDNACVIGDCVSVGHNCTIHGCTIESNVIVGMGATVLSWAKIGKNSIIGAGSVVTEKTIIPENSIAVGAPAKIVKKAAKKHLQRIETNWKAYVGLAKKYSRQ